MKIQELLFLLLVLFFLFLIDSLFIEPNLLIIKRTKIKIGICKSSNKLSESKKIVLISDLHLLDFKGKRFLHRLVKKINSLKNIDYIFIAGDFLYFSNTQIDSQVLKDIFSPLKLLKVPTYCVLGNHDWKYKNLLENVLQKQGCKVLNNEYIDLKKFVLVGLGPFSYNADDISIFSKINKRPVIVLTHNPDTTLRYKKFVDLTLCGHTHGGQIRIPFLYNFFIPTRGDFDKGLVQTKYGKIFITPGVGEVFLPMRFLNPSEIDVIEIY